MTTYLRSRSLKPVVRNEGPSRHEIEGIAVGRLVGFDVGLAVGRLDGFRVGRFDCCLVGASVVGLVVGVRVEDSVGESLSKLTFQSVV